MKAYDNSTENWGEEYKTSAAKTINSIMSTQQNIWGLADYYCEPRDRLYLSGFDYCYTLGTTTPNTAFPG